MKMAITMLILFGLCAASCTNSTSAKHSNAIVERLQIENDSLKTIFSQQVNKSKNPISTFLNFSFKKCRKPVILFEY